MERWTERQIEGWIYGWMDIWTDGQIDRWTDGRMDGWMDGWMDEWMDGWMDGWIHSWMDGWTKRRIDRCFFGVFRQFHLPSWLHSHTGMSDDDLTGQPVLTTSKGSQYSLYTGSTHTSSTYILAPREIRAN